MAIDEFWTNVARAAGSIIPNVSEDAPTLEAKQVKKLLESDPAWLKPSTVDGFDVQDFSFLPETERSRLAKAVDAFTAIAKAVPTGKSPGSNQIQKGASHFLTILEVLRPDRYGDAEALVTGKKLEGLLSGTLPPWVIGFRFQTGQDAQSEPAIWIWVEIEDSAAKGSELGKNSQDVRRLVDSAFARLPTSSPAKRFWPYVRFRTRSESTPQKSR